jgi:RNA polymerase sporulation-specific sigma factor
LFPENAQYYVAIGAALASKGKETFNINQLVHKVQNLSHISLEDVHRLEPLFSDMEEWQRFKARHDQEKAIRGNLAEFEGDNFDLGQNVRFSTYAVPMVIGEIRRYLRDNNAVRVSRSLRDIAYKALQAREKLVNANEAEPSISQIAQELAIPREEVVFALDAIQEPVSLFEPIYNDGGDPILVMDQISDDKNTDEQWLEEISIREAMKKLNEREKHIVNLRFFSGKTQMEVAEEIGISQAQVSRLEKAALKQLKKHI